MTLNAGRGRQWVARYEAEDTDEGRPFRAMLIMLWIFGLDSKSSGKTVENFKQTSDMTRCTFLKKDHYEA